jgi:hypothetical protein
MKRAHGLKSASDLRNLREPFPLFLTLNPFQILF